ncbi:MAG: SLBB domain-containing protein [Planctomycetaceae bacterium]|nr:SLBB domain-containing protein [Planctomycetaceae bacterium]
MLAQDIPRSAVTHWLTAGFCLWLTASAGAQAPASKTIVWGSANASGIKHYAILGEVVRPGVYSADGDATLQSVVQSAGGLTGSASPAIRIVRGDRGGQTLFFNPQGNDLLRPGDYIVVDLQPRPDPAASGAVATRPDGVWIGLSGVLSRPVVVRLHPQDAYLRTIVEGGLRQSTQLARAARMILPPQISSFNAGTDQIPNGSIISLPASLLVQKEIPALPPAIAMNVVAPPPAISTRNMFDPGQPRTPAVDLANNGPVAPPMIEVPAPPAETPLNTPRSFDRELSASTLPFSSGRDLEVPANPASLPAPGSRLAAQLAPPPMPTPSTEPVRIDANLTAMDRERDADSESDLVGEAAISAKPSTFSLWQMLGIGGTVASLVGIALGTRQYLERTTPLPSADQEFRRSAAPLRAAMPVEAPAPAAEMAVVPDAVSVERPAAGTMSPGPTAITPIPLSALLKNSIPIVSEPADFPERARLQKPTAAASTLWRLDEAAGQPVPAPHVNPLEISTAAPILGLDEPASAAIPRPHFRTAPARKPDGDLATAAAEEAPLVAEVEIPAERSSVRASGKTSVERALSQLQRGRHA